MEFGKPVIATDSTAIREVFSDCQGVIRCDPNQPQEWVLAIKSLSSDVGKLRAHGAANQAFARDKLDWGKTQAELLSRLQALLVTSSQSRMI